MIICGDNLPQSELNELLFEFDGGAATEVNVSLETREISFGEGEKSAENKTKNCELNFTVSSGNLIKKYAYKSVFEDFIDEKRKVKRYAKLSLYNFLCEKFGVTLDWGALTGIRPTKLYYQQGENAEDFLLNQMGVSQKKFDVLQKIAEAQKPYYHPDEDAVAFYAGIPFCPSRCQYCSFISCEIGKTNMLEDYVNALCYEIKESKKFIKKLRSVYVGGGTPVSLPLNLLEKVLCAIGDVPCEYTVEAGRADCINAEVLKLLKDHGVTRVCVNPQTFCDDTLKLMGRNHTAKEAEEKYYLAKSFGFDVNMDLIAGLPLETFGTFSSSLEKALSLRPENLTVHTLCLKKGSKLKELCSRLPAGETDRMIDYSSRRTAEEGYEPYYLYRQKYMSDNLENTGYSLPQKECVYNVDVMEEIAQNVACGANAVSKRVFLTQNRIERYGAPKDIATYCEKIKKITEEKSKLFGL